MRLWDLRYWGVEYDRILGDISIGLEFSTDWDNEKRHGYYDVILEKICIILDGRKKLSSRHIMGIIIHELRHAYEFKRYYNFVHRSRGTLEQDNKWLKAGEDMHYLTRKYEVSARLSQAMKYAVDILTDMFYGGEIDIVRIS